MAHAETKVPAPAPFTTALLYFIAGAVWIALSSQLVTTAVDTSTARQQWELLKGLLFVVASSGLLYFLLREKSRGGAEVATPTRIGRGSGLIAIIVTLMLLVPAIGIGVVYRYIPALERQSYDSLRSVAEHQFANIELWARERVRDTRAIGGNRHFLRQVAALQQDGNASDGVDDAVREVLLSYQQAYQYRAISLLDSQGRPLLSVGDDATPMPGNLRQLLAGFSAADSAETKIIAVPMKDDRLAVDFLAPLHGGEGGREIIGYLLLNSAPDGFLANRLTTAPSPFRTLKTLVIRPEVGGATLLRVKDERQDELSLSRIAPVDNPLLDEITRRFPGSGEIRYAETSGKEVLAFFRPLANPQWYLVAKVDRNEILAPVRRLLAMISMLSFVTLTTLAGALLLVWRQQKKNYHLSLIASSAEHEHAMRQQEQVYREMFVANPHPMWAYEVDSLRFLAVNEAAIRHYGYSHDEFMAMTIADIRPRDDVPKLLQHVEDQTVTGIDYAGIWHHRKKDGILIQVEISSHRLSFNGQNAELVLAYDVTETIRAQQQLLAAERFTKCTLDSLDMNIAVLDDNGRIIATNESWEAFAANNGGHYSATGSGANYLEVCRRAAPGDPGSERMLEGLEAILAGRRDRFSLEYFCPSASGERWFLAHVVRFREQSPTRVVVAHEDITRRKKAEIELRKLNQYYAALSALNNVIIRARDAEQMLQQVCELAVVHTGLEQVSVGRVEGNRLLTGHIASGTTSQFTWDSALFTELQLDSSDSVTTEAAREGKTIVVNNLYEDPRTRGWASDHDIGPMQSLTACPILRKGTNWGVIAFLANEAGYFTPDLVRLLEEMTKDVAYCLDMLDMEKARDEAEAQLLLNANIIESTHEGLFITDVDNRITMVNKAMAEITGYSREELIGRDPMVLNSGQQSESFYEELRGRLKANERWEGEIWDRRKNGEAYPAWLSITRVHDNRDANDHHIALYRDITERKEYERRIEHLATHDLLTNLPNRLMLEDRATVAIAQAKRLGHHLALLFIDLDNFKLINDTLGHDTGDQLLKGTALRIASVLRTSDTVCRVGGDEFVALVTDLKTPEEAALIAEKIIAEISQPLTVNEHTLIVTGSIGVALYPDNAADLEELTRRADAAMIEAKQSGHNRYRLYTGHMEEDGVEHFRMLNELRGALSHHQLFLVYQPQFGLKRKEIIGMESLVRWKHPAFGMVPPARFIPIAEDSGLIIEIGHWILSEACRQTNVWRRQGLIDFPVSVNVSALQFRQLNFVETVQQILQHTGLPGHYLELEVTESVLMTNQEDVLEKLERLERLGVRIAIDDFGTGYSSLSYLRQFSAHRIKIDKSFIQDLPDDKDAKAIARAIVSMGNTLEMEIVAEGIETEVQANYLSGIGCRFGQGFLYARPMAASTLEEWLASKTTVEA